MNGTIAGHTFHEASQGRVCRYCTKRWVDVSGVTRANIGQPNWAHVGDLLEREYDEICAEVERMFETVIEAATT